MMFIHTKYNLWKTMKDCIFDQDKGKTKQLFAPTKARFTFTFNGIKIICKDMKSSM